MDKVILVPDLIEYAFVWVSLSGAKVMKESIQINHVTRFTNVCAHQITGICEFFLHPEKACLKIFSAWNACNYCCLEEAP